MLPEYSNNSKARHYHEQALDYYQTLDKKMKFGNKELMKMEMNILHALDWKTKQTLPFCFVPYFLHFLIVPPGFTRLPVHKIIVWTQAEIRFTKFRPSIVAASAILCALEKLFPDDPNYFTSVILSRYAHFDSTIKDELAECLDMIQTMYQKKLNSLVIAKGLINDGVGISQPANLAPDKAFMVPSGSGKEIIEEGSQRHIKETIDAESKEGVTGLQTMPEQSSSPGDGQESLEEGVRRQGERSVTEEASTTITYIQMALKQSSSPGDGCESSVKQSHRPGKGPTDEKSSKAIGKKQVAHKQSPYTSDDDPEGVEEGFCGPKKMLVAEIEEPALALVENLLMNFELGWDDQNPYSHGCGMCSLCNAIARCWPIPIFEAREQTLEWLRDSWEWLLNFPENIGLTNKEAAQRPWESFHEADSKLSSDPESYGIQDFFQ